MCPHYMDTAVVIIYLYFLIVTLRTLEKEMATHSSILAWRIPWTEEPGGLQSMGSQRIGHDWVTNTHTHTHCEPSHSIECHLLLQGIFPTQELNPGLLHLLCWQADSLLLSHWGSQCLHKNLKIHCYNTCIIKPTLKLEIRRWVKDVMIFKNC